MKMLSDCDLFAQLCENRGISAPAEVFEAIKRGSSTGELRLSCMSIVVPICGILARMLTSSSTIRMVDLSDCMLLSKGLSSILNALSEGSNITSLNLKGNNINGPVVAQLGKIFHHNNTLKRLSIEWNSLGTDIDAFENFCDGISTNHNIEELDLRYNQISPNCAETLAKALRTNKSLKTVDLAWNTLGLRGGQLLLNVMRENRTITKLNLRGNCIPDEIVFSIEECIHKNQSRNLVSQANISESIIKIVNFEENLIDTSNKLINDNLMIIEPPKIRLNVAPSDEIRETESEPDNSILSTKIVGVIGEDIDESETNFKIVEATTKISELNHMLQERSAAIELLTKQIDTRAEETEAARNLVKRMENEIRLLKEERESLNLEKSREIAQLRENQKKSDDNWQREYKKLQETLKESLLREKELETRVQRQERELRKNYAETTTLKEKTTSQTQIYEDLIAKNRVELHRVRREMKERENRHKIELNILKNTLKDGTEALEDCQAQLQKSRAELRETLENLSSVRTRLGEVERINCRLLRIEESYEKLKDEKKLLEEQILDSQRTIAALQRQIATLQGELIEPKRRYDLVKDELEQEREKSVRLKREVADERSALQQQNSQIQSLNAQITALNNQINDIQNSHIEALRERDKERKLLKEIISNKERDFIELKSDEVQRVSHLYAAFSKYFGSIGPNTKLYNN